ncbi:MAG: nickel-type superoxide dismutase maturation protease [Synechococcus sp. ArSW.bin.68]
MSLLDLLLLFCGRRRVMQVDGYSMWPTLKPKDRVILRPLNQHSELPAIGTIIVCIHPQQPSRRVIKRLSCVTDNQLTILGDCPDASTDSRQWGRIPKACLIGEVVALASTPLEQIS